MAENKRKVVVVVTDGVGIAEPNPGNAVDLARTPTLDEHWGPDPFSRSYSTKNSHSLLLSAHGESVGLPSGVMGNSEVGHSTIFCGCPYDEMLPALAKGFSDGSLFENSSWKKIINRSATKNNNTVHLLGLLSDGQVHSDISHVLSMVKECAASQVKKLRIWALTDGRDVSPSSAQEYVKKIESEFARINSKDGFDYSFAMIAGRAATLMDRGEDHWGRVEKAWDALFFSEGQLSDSALQSVDELRSELEAELGNSQFTDEHLGLRLIKNPDGSAPKVDSGDSLILFNYRTDRILQFCSWMLGQELSVKAKSQGVARKERPSDILFLTMGDFDPSTLPLENFLLPRLKIDTTLIKYLGEKGAKVFCCSEPSKFPHVTLFPNARSNEKPEHCTWHLVPSEQRPPFNRLPMMQTANIALETTQAMKEGEHDLLIVNFPSPDMVGHETNIPAVIEAVEAADFGMAEICRVAEETGHVVVYGGDHGNSERMYVFENGEVVEKEGKPVWHTAHTVNPVRWVIFDPRGVENWKLNEAVASLGNLSSTIAQLMGYVENIPSHWLRSLLK